MISHEIIVKKKNVYQWPTQPTPLAPKPLFENQEEYDAHLKRHEFNPGDIVAFKSNNNGLTKWNLHVVITTHKDFDTAVWRQSTGLPVSLLLCQVHSPEARDVTPWLRWDDLPGYRKLTKEEYQKLVEPDYDLIQNLISERRAMAKREYPSYFTDES